MVKLESEVGSWDERNLVVKIVIEIHCVKMVCNNMTIDRNMAKIN